MNGVIVECKNPTDHPKLVNGLKSLVNYDALIKVSIDESGKFLVSGAGELHLETVLTEWTQQCMSNVDLIISPMQIPFRETVIETSNQNVFIKSPNQKNQILASAMPLDNEIAKAIENKKWDVSQITSHFGWNATETRKIWSLGGNFGNLLIDSTTEGIPNYLDLIKESVVTGFQWAIREGVLANEPVQSVQYKILDVSFHEDSIFRGSAQIIPTARKAFSVAQLTAEPRLMEPIYLIEIQAPQTQLEKIHSAIKTRRGYVIDKFQTTSSPLWNLMGYLPIIESHCFTSELRKITEGQVFVEFTFDHWEVFPISPFDHQNLKCKEIIESIRKTRGLKIQIPSIETFI